jgi:glycogenin glucosyltransferase
LGCKQVSFLETLLIYVLTLDRAPPPADSKPEAHNFPATQYNMSSDPTPFKAPDRYPDPPKDMYYEVPKTPTYQKPAPLFPWEKNAPKPTRVFPEDNIEIAEVPSTSNQGPSLEDEEPLPAVKSTDPTIQVTSTDPWQTFTRGNAWDDIPEIERYIGNLQKNRKGNIQVLQGYGSGIEQVSSPGARRQSMRLTDFPTELERPSLPVTPAPIRRPTFWGEERDDDGELPAAEGVPSQEDWVSLALFLTAEDFNLPTIGSSSPTGATRPATIRCACQQAWEGWWRIEGDADARITIWIRGGHIAHLLRSH